MELNRNQMYGMGIFALVAAGAYTVYSQSHKPVQHGVSIGELAEPNYATHPMIQFMGVGRLGPCNYNMYATKVMENCSPQAIQQAEGTISVSAIAEAPKYEHVPSQLGGARG